MTFYGHNDDAALDLEIERFEGGLEGYSRSILYFHILEKESRKVIGWCGYHTWILKHHRAEIGYCLYREEDRKKGLMSEALEAVLKYGFEEMDLNRVEALTSYDNEASIASLVKFGFQEEGILKGHYYVDGLAEDSVMYALLKSEFEQH